MKERKISLLADGQRQAGVDGTAVGGTIISRKQVGSGAVLVIGLADGRGAGGRLAHGGNNGETVLGELRVGLHVNAGQIPEDGVGGTLGVLELEHIVLVGIGGQLDGDTATVGVGPPGLGVGATVSGQGLHGADGVGHRPGVHILVQVVGDQDGAAGGGAGAVAATGHHA